MKTFLTDETFLTVSWQIDCPKCGKMEVVGMAGGPHAPSSNIEECIASLEYTLGWFPQMPGCNHMPKSLQVKHNKCTEWV